MTYLKTAFRSLLRQRLYAGLNTLGLMLGIASCLIVGLYVHHELTYDQFLPNADRIYEISKHETLKDRNYVKSPLSDKFSSQELQALTTDMLESIHIVRKSEPMQVLVKTATGIKNTIEKEVHYVSANFLQGLQFTLIEGDPASCLRLPNNIVLTQTTAEQYFGNESALGKTLRLRERGDSIGKDYVVSAIAKNIPTNSSLRFSMLIPANPQLEYYSTVYGILRQNVSVERIHDLEQMLMHYDSTHRAEDYTARKQKIILHSLLGKHIRLQERSSPDGWASEPTTLWGQLQSGNTLVVRLLIMFGLAITMIAIACINYVNLQTARALTRTQEIGIRKVLGAYRGHLIGQFFVETLVLVVIACAGALTLTEFSLSFINTRLSIVLHLSSLISIGGILSLGAGILGVSVLCGLYPALYISRFDSAHILRSHGAQSRENAWLRKGLVIVQFTASITLMICMTVMQQQLHYMENKSLGFDKNHVFCVDLNDSYLQERSDLLRNELQTISGIQNISFSSITLTGDVYSSIAPNRDQPGAVLIYRAMGVDNNFGATMNIPVVQGRWFTNGDSSVCVVNQAYVRENQLQNPVGSLWLKRRIIVGVVEDFHYESVKEPIHSLILVPTTLSLWLSHVIVKLSPGTTFETADQVRAVLKRLDPNTAFTTYFLDEKLNTFYHNENIMAGIVSVLGTMTLVVACLGLLGLTAFTVERKTKEISIRKIMGASKTHILLLLAKDFLVLVTIAIVLAMPLAWVSMNHWLRDFNYRISLQPWVFVGVGCVAIVLALMTISLQAMKTISANPADTLRSE